MQKHFATVRDKVEHSCDKVTGKAAQVHTKKAHKGRVEEYLHSLFTLTLNGRER
jgi:hypothetical protein